MTSRTSWSNCYAQRSDIGRKNDVVVDGVGKPLIHCIHGAVVKKPLLTESGPHAVAIGARNSAPVIAATLTTGC